MEFPASISEDHGLAILSDENLQIYSIGISTGGIAEIRMAHMNPKRHIIATTVDKEGVAFAQKYIAEQELGGQIEARVEDVTQRPLPYADDHFDYIYARLVLHYLSKQQLEATLPELRRILKPGGKLYVVVRSTDCPDAIRKEAQYDPETHLTIGDFTDEKTGRRYSYRRYFHTQGSICAYMTQANFNVVYTKTYDEHLFSDFMRTQKSPATDNVIELLATKPAG
jgi:SAM-dependent methyltransferase